ncbi:MBL fold metallo-hydrolase [Chloroflexota bacterium]
MEVVDGIHQLKIPSPQGLPQHVNVYLVRGKDGWLLVDTGWDTPEALVFLERQLKEIGLGFQDIAQIVVTHIHPDHYGMAGRIKQLSGAKLALHHVEKGFIESRYVDMEDLLAEMTQLLQSNGAPEPELAKFYRASLAVKEYVYPVLPDIALQGSEWISTDLFHFQAIWTPGHSPGHVCLYEPESKILISGDLILPVTTPNISFNVQAGANPLSEYLESLARIGQLEVDLVLPGHEIVFRDIHQRIDEMHHHHEERAEAILDVIRSQPETAYNIATQIIWAPEFGGVAWQDLAPMDRRMALVETLAHLEFLRLGERAEKSARNGTNFYCAYKAS